MSLNSAGVIAWADPLAGSYSVTVTATDSKTGLSGKGLFNIAIAAPKPPLVSVATITGHTGSVLTYAVSASSVNPLIYTLSGAPSGMSISSVGVLHWSAPVVGKYSVKVNATDSRTGLSGQGIFTVNIVASGPTITAAAMDGVVGKALTGTISFADSTSNKLLITFTGVPKGVALASSGSTVNVRWAAPVIGNYLLGASVKDGNGQTATLNVPVTITGK
jgi:hypothetical protein